MTRKSIFDIIKDKYDINNEFEKITALFNSKIIELTTQNIYSPMHVRKNYYTLEDMIEDVFYGWKGRGSCISYKNMRDELGIDKIINNYKRSVDDVIVALEYYENISNLFCKKVAPKLSTYQYTMSHNWEIYSDNVFMLLDYLHCELYFPNDDIVLIIPKNPAATAVAEISSKDTAMAILMYHHASLKGQIEEKRKLLQTIANEYESLLKNPIEGYAEYFKTARGMLNNLNIRHNNIEGKNKKEFIANMKDKELECWYDELYQLLLFCILIKDNKDRKSKMEKFLKKLKEVAND